MAKRKISGIINATEHPMNLETPWNQKGRPLFNEATVHLKDGKSFKVIAHNNSRDNKYVQSIVLNGNKLETPFFTHQDIVDGGTLELTMGAEPLMPDNELRK